VELDIKESMIAWRPQGSKTGISLLEIGIKNQTFLEKPEVRILNSD